MQVLADTVFWSVMLFGLWRAVLYAVLRAQVRSYHDKYGEWPRAWKGDRG